MSRYNPVDEFVRNVLFYFPSLYESRTEVLCHALCTIGGGNNWEFGEISQDHDHWAYEQMKPHHEDPQAKLADFYREFYEDQVRRLTHGRQFKDEERPNEIEHPDSWRIDYWEKEAEESTARVREIRGNIGKQIYVRKDVNSFYPMSEEYSNLAVIPDDINDDWLEACEEIALLVIKHDGYVTGGDEWITAAKKNVEIAQAALTRVDEIKRERVTE